MDDYTTHIYNDKNKEITLSDVQCILRSYGIQASPNNIELYKRSFVHSSYVKSNMHSSQTANCPLHCVKLKSKSNERLEFIGDGVLELIIKYYLYRRFPKEDEGFMTEKKIALVKNEHIGKLAYQMHLHEWLIISKHAEEKNIRTNLKKLGCLFEAFIGAIFLDFNKISIHDQEGWFQHTFVCGPGFQMAQLFVENVFEKYVDWQNLIQIDDNYKNILQVKVQKIFKLTPDYIELSRDMNEGYHIGVYICLGQSIHNMNPLLAEPFEKYGSFESIQETSLKRPVFVLLGTYKHPVKKKAEQFACKQIIINLAN
jgi:dsRNA-specific ribonuclease